MYGKPLQSIQYMEFYIWSNAVWSLVWWQTTDSITKANWYNIMCLLNFYLYILF